MECDNGIFKPLGFRFQGSAAGLAAAQRAAGPLERIGASRVEAGEGEADTGPLIDKGVPGLALDVDPSRYFWYHHSWGDMMTVVDRGDFQRCVAAMAVISYLIADSDALIPR